MNVFLKNFGILIFVSLVVTFFFFHDGDKPNYGYFALGIWDSLVAFSVFNFKKKSDKSITKESISRNIQDSVIRVLQEERRHGGILSKNK